MAGVALRDAVAAGGLVNVAHHIGGAFGPRHPRHRLRLRRPRSHGARDVLAHPVSAGLTAATVLLVLALVVSLMARPRAAPRYTEVFPDQPSTL